MSKYKPHNDEAMARTLQDYRDSIPASVRESLKQIMLENAEDDEGLDGYIMAVKYVMAEALAGNVSPELLDSCRGYCHPDQPHPEGPGHRRRLRFPDGGPGEEASREEVREPPTTSAIGVIMPKDETNPMDVATVVAGPRYHVQAEEPEVKTPLYRLYEYQDWRQEIERLPFDHWAELLILVSDNDLDLTEAAMLYGLDEAELQSLYTINRAIGWTTTQAQFWTTHGLHLTDSDSPQVKWLEVDLYRRYQAAVASGLTMMDIQTIREGIAKDDDHPQHYYIRKQVKNRNAILGDWLMRGQAS